MANNLLKKIAHLKDLREAIKIVKKDQEEQVKKFAPNMDSGLAGISDVSPSLGKSPVFERTKPQLARLGTKQTYKGHTTHLFGIKGSEAPYYELHVEHPTSFDDKVKFKAAQVMPNGKVSDMAPKHYEKSQDAIKAIVKHYYNGHWE